MPDKNTAVISFPNTGANYNSPQLSSFPAIYSSFSETMGSSSATNAHAEASQLADYDAVICLAALSNDPVGQLNPAATHSINHEGTLRLARAAKQAGVERFLFASSCSLYGAAGSQAVAEDAELFPALWRDQSAGRA